MNATTSPSSPLPEGRADGREEVILSTLRAAADLIDAANGRTEEGFDIAHASSWLRSRASEIELAAPVVAVREAGEAPLVWLPGMLATIWWAVDGGPIGVNHAMRRDSDWVACGDVAVPDEYVIWAVRINPPDVEQLPPADLVLALLEAVEADFELNGHAANAAAVALRDYVDASEASPAPVVGGREEKP